MNKKITALVTAVGGRSVGYQIFECLRRCKNEYRIIATDADPFSPGLYEADKGYLLPESASNTYIPSLIEIAKKEKVAVILPGSIPETFVVSQNEKILLENNIIPVVNPFSLVKGTHDKLDVYSLLKENNLLTPKTKELKSVSDAEELEYPLIIKPRIGGSGSKNVHILKNKKELLEIFKTIARENVSILVQEYVGNENEEYTVGVVAGKDRRIIDSIVMRRKLIGLSRGEEKVIDGKSYVLSTGYSQGFIVDQPDVKDYCEEAVRRFGARGPFNIQARKGKKGVYIFELHPRFSGSASMRAEIGFNEPHVLIREFLGIEKLDRIPHKTGFAIMRKFANAVVEMDAYNNLKKSL